jgi:hypothetical protein
MDEYRSNQNEIGHDRDEKTRALRDDERHRRALFVYHKKVCYPNLTCHCFPHISLKMVIDYGHTANDCIKTAAS